MLEKTPRPSKNDSLTYCVVRTGEFVARRYLSLGIMLGMREQHTFRVPALLIAILLFRLVSAFTWDNSAMTGEMGEGHRSHQYINTQGRLKPQQRIEVYSITVVKHGNERNWLEDPEGAIVLCMTFFSHRAP